MSQEKSNVREFRFDLDLEPGERWKLVFESYSDKEIQDLVDFGRGLLAPIQNGLTVCEQALKVYPSSGIMYLDELNYIASVCKITFSEVLALQLIYEANAACTTAMWNVGGMPHLFRTMDWETTFLRKYTIKLNIHKNGEYVGEAVTWLGFVGFFTATSWKHDYSIMVNYRRTSDTLTLIDLGMNVLRVVTGYFPIAYLVRNTLESYNYDSGLKFLKNTSWARINI